MKDFLSAVLSVGVAIAISYLVALVIFTVGSLANGLNPLSVCWEWFNIAPLYPISLWLALGMALWPFLQTDY